MWYRTLIVAGLAVVGVASGAGAGSSVVGIVTSVGDKSLEVTQSERHTQMIAIDEKTTYMKWITHKPWQQAANAGSRALTVGRCVDVDLRSGTTNVASTIRINVGDEGTVFDPCKGIR